MHNRISKEHTHADAPSTVSHHVDFSVLERAAVIHA